MVPYTPLPGWGWHLSSDDMATVREIPVCGCYGVVEKAHSQLLFRVNMNDTTAQRIFWAPFPCYRQAGSTTAKSATSPNPGNNSIKFCVVDLVA